VMDKSGDWLAWSSVLMLATCAGMSWWTSRLELIRLEQVLRLARDRLALIVWMVPEPAKQSQPLARIRRSEPETGY
jgi:hypothetical protein